MNKYILSYIQVEPILKSRKDTFAMISLDLGLTISKIGLEKVGVIFPDGQKINWKDLEKIYKHKNRCYLVEDNQVSPIVFYSDKTGWVRTLYPTLKAPTTLVSGILMHRIKETDPIEDTQSKIKTLGNLNRAVVLDTATGLGYTAIEAAKKGAKVVTVEFDPAALEVARLNPWSKNLFDNPKIVQVLGNILEEVQKFGVEEFSHIVHDPPTQKIAGELYSGNLYNQFYRVLKKGGKIFHYIGDPDSEHGATVTKGVIKRLQEAGFYKIEKKPEAFGVLAYKR
jgi:uncharacterized protein